MINGGSRSRQFYSDDGWPKLVMLVTVVAVLDAGILFLVWIWLR